MTNPQPSLVIEMKDPGPVMNSGPEELGIYRDPLTHWEGFEKRVAIVALHVGNVLRQAVGPIENKSGIRILGRLGIPEQPRKLIDYRPTHPLRQVLVNLGLVQQNRPNPDQHYSEIDRQ